MHLVKAIGVNVGFLSCSIAFLAGTSVCSNGAQGTPTQSHISPSILVFEDLQYCVCQALAFAAMERAHACADPLEAAEAPPLPPPAEPYTLNPKPHTPTPKPSTLNPQLSTLNSQPSTLNPTPYTLNSQPHTPHRRRRGGARARPRSWISNLLSYSPLSADKLA